MFLPLFLASLALAAVDASDTKSFEILGIKLNSDSYSVVVDKLGDTKLIRPKSTGAGYDGDATFCYRGKSGFRLTFRQGFSEAYTHVTGYDIEAAPLKPNKNCKSSRALKSPPKLPNGLALGLNKAEVEKILGAPKTSTLNSSTYEFEKQAEYAPGKGTSYSLSVNVTYDKKEKVRALGVDFGAEPL